MQLPSDRSVTSSGHSLLVFRNRPPVASAGAGAGDLSPPWSQDLSLLLALPLGPFSDSSFSLLSLNSLSEQFFPRVWAVTRVLQSLHSCWLS